MGSSEVLVLQHTVPDHLSHCIESLSFECLFLDIPFPHPYSPNIIVIPDATCSLEMIVAILEMKVVLKPHSSL